MILVLLVISFFPKIMTTEDFIIDTEVCRMPNFPAFSVEANMTYYPVPYVPCADLDLLTYTSVENNTAYLHLRSEHINQYYKSEEEIDCCYSYVVRNGTEEEPDVGISISTCQFFNSSVTLEGDTVMVKCYIGADKIYENVHNPITVPNSIKEKLKTSYDVKPLSILLIVIDSISRLNLARSMPNTRRFLLDNGFTEFLGYNKIDDNTFPNFNALLTGLNLRQSNSICEPTKVGKLDECPMIWYDFRKAGYVTAYAEDWAPISTYNYLKKGFRNPPTDYYFKPYVEACEFLDVSLLDTMPYCAGPESEGERILNLAKDFSTTFKSSPTFGIFWMNTFSHNYINSPSRMDDKVKNFFEALKDNGIFNESMVVLLSDHGVRFGGIRETIQGWYEERLPTNFISIPAWFQKKHPGKYANFKTNANKLTSTYDMYMTLQEVLAMSVRNYTAINSTACSKCRSLFSRIPERRSCKQAGIPEAWCTCLGKFDRNDTAINQEANKKALKVIMDKNVLEPLDSTILHIISSSISRSPHGQMYLLIVFQTETLAIYRALLRIKIDPFDVVKLVNLMRIY